MSDVIKEVILVLTVACSRTQTTYDPKPHRTVMKPLWNHSFLQDPPLAEPVQASCAYVYTGLWGSPIGCRLLYIG